MRRLPILAADSVRRLCQKFVDCSNDPRLQCGCGRGLASGATDIRSWPKAALIRPPRMGRQPATAVGQTRPRRPPPRFAYGAAGAPQQALCLFFGGVYWITSSVRASSLAGTSRTERKAYVGLLLIPGLISPPSVMSICNMRLLVSRRSERVGKVEPHSRTLNRVRCGAWDLRLAP